MALGLQTKLTYFYYLILKGSFTILNMKVVPNDIFKFGGERVICIYNSLPLALSLYGYVSKCASTGIIDERCQKSTALNEKKIGMLNRHG